MNLPIIRPEGNGSEIIKSNIDIDAFKSNYYLLNAKPDTNIKVFKESRLVSNQDIHDLNEHIQEKLKNHEIITYITSIDVFLDEGKIKSFNAWAEFERSNWGIPEKTESVSITWDINIQLPRYEIPQRHTMKIRIGSEIKPIEMFQLITSGDNDIELTENTVFLICKVDFINHILSNELIGIVEDWYKCLPKNESKGRMQKIIEDNANTVSNFVHVLVPIIGLTLLYTCFKIYTPLSQNLNLEQFLYRQIFIWLILGIATFSMFNLIGHLIARKVFKTIRKFSDPPIFKITKGDENNLKEINEKNKKIKTNLSIQIFLTCISEVISIFLTKIVEKFIK